MTVQNNDQHDMELGGSVRGWWVGGLVSENRYRNASRKILGPDIYVRIHEWVENSARVSCYFSIAVLHAMTVHNHNRNSQTFGIEFAQALHRYAVLGHVGKCRLSTYCL